MTESIEQQMLLVQYPRPSTLSDLGVGDKETGVYTAGHDMGAEAQRSADAKWIEEQELVRLPSVDRLKEIIGEVGMPLLVGGTVVGVGQVQALHRALKERSE